jgi:hypothetical protein
VKYGWKNFEKQKTNHNHRRGARGKTKNKGDTTHFCVLRDHFDPFDGALISY